MDRSEFSARADGDAIRAARIRWNGSRQRRRPPGVQPHGQLALALALLVASCGGPPPVRCQGNDLDDQMMSTRTVFLERLAGCPIGGRN